MKSLKDIGSTLKTLRGNQSPGEAAFTLGISKSALFMYERGERMPRDEVKERIASHYGSTVQHIFFD